MNAEEIIDEIKKLIKGPPDKLIKRLEELDFDFNKLDKNIAKTLVREYVHLTEEEFEIVDFVFWISYFVERQVEELIKFPEVSMGAREEAMDSIISKLHFGDKIKIIEELHTSKKDPLVKIMRKIQDLRNDIAHGRFEKLEYKRYSLNDNKGKLMLIGDLKNALLKKTARTINNLGSNSDR